MNLCHAKKHFVSIFWLTRVKSRLCGLCHSDLQPFVKQQMFSLRIKTSMANRGLNTHSRSYSSKAVCQLFDWDQTTFLGHLRKPLWITWFRGNSQKFWLRKSEFTQFAKMFNLKKFPFYGIRLRPNHFGISKMLLRVYISWWLLLYNVVWTKSTPSKLWPSQEGLKKVETSTKECSLLILHCMTPKQSSLNQIALPQEVYTMILFI